MTPEVQAALQSWSAPIGVDASLCLAAAVYARGWNRLRIVFARQFPFWRLAVFFAGVGAVWLAIGSPLEALDDASLIVHMVQHLLLAAVAPPLILLGAPALPLLRGLPQWMAHGVVSPLLRLRLVRWSGRLVSNPAICLLVATLALIAWHVPSIFELALRWDWLHKLEHASFLVAGLMFWWPVVQPWPSTPKWPRWAIPLYLFCATLPCDALSGFLTFCDRVVYASYLSAPRIFNISPLDDQECAAALMWVCVTILLLVPAVVVTMQILSPDRAHLPKETWAGIHTIADQPLDASKLEVGWPSR